MLTKSTISSLPPSLPPPPPPSLYAILRYAMLESLL